ncbi:MAG: hypothetical protein V3T83_03620 [Acidobacteriota bacterium]
MKKKAKKRRTVPDRALAGIGALLGLAVSRWLTRLLYRENMGRCAINYRSIKTKLVEKEFS